MNPTEQVPDWVMRPLPANAVADEKLLTKIDQVCQQLPDSFDELRARLEKVSMFHQYDMAANRASAHIWLMLDKLYSSEEHETRRSLIYFAQEHMSDQAQAKIYRRLAKDPHPSVRRLVQSVLRKSDVREVALPLTDKSAWDQSGWIYGSLYDDRRPLSVSISTADYGLRRHKGSTKRLEELGLPVIRTVGELRELLDIRSGRQLGYFLLASEKHDGPYTKFSIPKRNSEPRDICAPKPQLLWVQRRILRNILDPLPTHDAAHGFVAGRSTVTNAEKHRKAKIILKFDLSDFFPTIHYFRVLGFFASLGYDMENGLFSAEAESREVAPTLARLCCYSPQPKKFGDAKLPQGAPTSPALSNLICRRLDARLEGLAKKCKGTYTRYADDLTFSFKNLKTSVGRFRWWVDQVCHQEGFYVNQKKFRVIRASQRQTVTGIVVNDVLRIPREERRRFRAILHNCEKQGYESQAKGRTDFDVYLRGFASYVHMVHPKEGKKLLKQVEQILSGK